MLCGRAVCHAARLARRRRRLIQPEKDLHHPHDECFRPVLKEQTGCSTASKKKRQHWSDEQDVLCLKAIFGVSAQVAPPCERTKLVKDAATAFNMQPQSAFHS